MFILKDYHHLLLSIFYIIFSNFLKAYIEIKFTGLRSKEKIMEKTDILNVKNFKKWILPILMFIFCEFIFKRKILPFIIKFKFTGDYIFDVILFQGLGCIIIIISVLLISKYVYNGKFNSIDASSKKGLKESFLFSIVILILTIIFFFVFSKFLTYILGVSIKSRNSEMNIYFLKYSKFTVFISVFVPIFEEIVYRKILFGYLYDLLSGCNKYVRFITSVLVSSVIFGSIHDGVFHPAMIYYVIYGVIFSSVYFYTKRISASMTVHVLNNLFLDIMNIFGI